MEFPPKKREKLDHNQQNTTNIVLKRGSFNYRYYLIRLETSIPSSLSNIDLVSLLSKSIQRSIGLMGGASPTPQVFHIAPMNEELTDFRIVLKRMKGQQVGSSDPEESKWISGLVMSTSLVVSKNANSFSKEEDCSDVMVRWTVLDVADRLCQLRST